MAQKKRRKLRIMGPKESIQDLGKRFNRLKKGSIGKSVSSAGEGLKKAGKWAQTRTFTGETSLFSKKQFSGGKKKTTKSKSKIAGAGDSPGAARAKAAAKARKKTIAQVQAENKKSMQAAARKRHDDFQKKNKRGKYRVSKK